MSEVYVLGRGGHSGSRTFVPSGTTVYFHTVLEPPLSRSRSYSHSPAAGPDNNIPNFVLTEPSGPAFAQRFAHGAPAGSVFVVADGKGYGDAVTVLTPVLDGLPLCTEPASCLESWPEHTEHCHGIFRLLPAGVADLHLVCLGAAAGHLSAEDQDSSGTR